MKKKHTPPKELSLIRKFMEERRITFEELGKASAYHRSYLNNVFSGFYPFTPRFINCVMEGLKKIAKNEEDRKILKKIYKEITCTYF